MSNYPAKFLPLYLTLMVFLSLPAFCAGKESAEMLQKQARDYRQQGWLFQERGDLESAMICYQKAMLADPNYAVAYNDVGVILEGLDQPEEAKQMYLKAIEVDPHYPNSYSNLALLYEAEKNYTNAVICWIQRTVLGGINDPWTEAARKRLQDIAEIYPQAFKSLGEEGEKHIQELDVSKLPPPEEPKLSEFPEPAQADFVSESTPPKADNKKLAEEHLMLAKESFNHGQYVSALKEATMAEYLDSSNKEISAFVDTVRKKLLK